MVCATSEVFKTILTDGNALRSVLARTSMRCLNQTATERMIWSGGRRWAFKGILGDRERRMSQ